jgi:hypothetical protein
MESKLLFEPPAYNKKLLHHVFNSNVALLKKIRMGFALDKREEKDLENLPSTLMICFLNGFEEAKQLLINSKLVLKEFGNANVYLSFKESMRILRKMKYDKNNE